MFSMIGAGFGFNQMNSLSGGMQMGLGLNIGGLNINMSLGLGGGMMGLGDSSMLSPEAMMGGGSNFFHPLMMGGGMGSPMGCMNGMGMVPGMMPGMGMNGMGGGNQQMQMMMMMMMQMMMMMMQMMQQQGMGAMGMPGMGMPGMGGFGCPMGMGMPGMGGMGMPGMGMPGGFGSPVGMNGGGYGNPGMGATAANPNAQIPSFGANANKGQVGQMLDAAAQKYGIPPNILKAVAWQESGWNPKASSFDGGHGKGVMQIDDRFHQFARTQDVWDPAKNIEYGAKYLRDLYNKTGDWNAALKRYNGGSSYPPKIMAHAQRQPWAKG